MFKDIHKKLLYLLFFILPLVHTKLLDTLFISTDIFVNGNYEFTKVIVFNTFSSLVFLCFIGEKVLIQKEKIFFPRKGIYFLLGILLTFIISTYFSLFPHISLWGNTEKSHGFFMFLNLMGLGIVLFNSTKKTLKYILSAYILSFLLVCILAGKELFFPTFDYGELSSRAIATFGHPNYLALFLLTLLPFFTEKKKYFPFTILALVTLILTQSILSIFLATLFLVLNYSRKKYIPGVILLAILSSGITIYLFPPEKLHSFVSRFYIWETTLKIIFSDIRIFFTGGGFGTLPIYFNSFKVPELYIFENFGFTADRPHNFFLNVGYHTGIGGVLLFMYGISLFGKHCLKKTLKSPEKSMLLFFAFTSFNYPSIAVYIFFIFCVILILKRYKKALLVSITPLFIGITLFSFSGTTQSLSLYQAEIYAYKKDYSAATNLFPKAKYYYAHGEIEKAQIYDTLPTQRFYTAQIQNFEDISKNCLALTHDFPSVENFFYCGSVLERLKQEDISIEYYEKGLEKLPDLWNPDSPYWEHPFVKNSISGNRFFSPKFSRLQEILEKLEIERK